MATGTIWDKITVMTTRIHELTSECHYIIGDAVEELRKLDDPASLIYLDDAWARPQRANQFGVTYPTHRFDDDGTQDASESTLTTVNVLDACWDALEEGGWLIADADDWLLPRLTTYLMDVWGDVAGTYSGGGYRRIGGVTYVAKSTGDPDRSTAGEYLTNGGYPVVFAHKGETDRKSSTSARQVCTRPQENYGWGSIKPCAPYEKWVDSLLDSGEHLVVPCAGTAPAAIAAERVFGEQAHYTCIDTELDAYNAFQARRDDELGYNVQQNIDIKS